ncbi:RNA-binding protein 45-like isoform X2 [Ruditapes philippinarum]|uniref:RNA-binding protein 45-like isoform X2 n=1 Tax=Ruditapes philippinarum TaxID=129788 RepID=UPI00295AA889|nr:RNA-binding protein 45-like isoform X2 [Ruditapes philippinarum]XP_060596437.1 RNA-binding protein 45-like isoform X2 [Ruditapes philippinarum]
MYRSDTKENTRLFVLAGKGVNEEVFREKFEQYGKIEDLWIVKDKRTNEDKGVVYVTYSKVSEAALALEEMNGKILPGNPRPLKVLVANTKRDGSVRDPREDERLVRLFVIIPKTYDEEDVNKEFSQHGDVASVNVLRDKDTGSPKGFAYVKFHRPYHAAIAMENCKPSFKPKWAEPKKQASDTVDRYARDSRNYHDGRDRDSYDDRGSRGYEHRDRDRRGSGAPGGYPYSDRDRGLKRGFDDYRDDRDSRRDRREDYIADDGRSRYSDSNVFSRPEQTPFSMIQDHQHNNIQRLLVTAPLGLTQNYLQKLFNLIPGLEYCDLNEQTGLAYVRYQTPQCAAYARDKLDGFEYPIGSRLIVKFTEGSGHSSQDQGFMSGNFRGGPEPLMDSSSVQHQAAKVLEQAGINPGLVLQPPKDSNAVERVTYCNLKLPLPKPLVPEDTPTAQRLFIVCQPAAVPERILRDAFSRFGNLIEVFLLSGRNFGYAKYATKESACLAMDVLHGQCVAGQRMKVLEAEPMRNEIDGIKRQRVESQ